MSFIETALHAEEAAIDTDLEWRRLRALRFVELVAIDGQVHQVAYKQLDLDPKVLDLERKARIAAAISQAAWLEARHQEVDE